MMAHGPFHLLVFSCHKFPVMHFLNERDLLRNVKKAKRRQGCFTQLPDNPWYSAPCVSISTLPARTARNCDIYGSVWEGNSWKTDFRMSLKYSLEDKREKGEGRRKKETDFCTTWNCIFRILFTISSISLEQWSHKQAGRTSEGLVKVKIKSIDCKGELCISKPQRNSGCKLSLYVRYYKITIRVLI